MLMLLLMLMLIFTYLVHFYTALFFIPFYVKLRLINCLDQFDILNNRKDSFNLFYFADVFAKLRPMYISKFIYSSIYIEVD